MKLVIVDDSMLILKFAEGTLKRNQVAIDIALCNSGEEALDYIRYHHTDIMLLDIIMPGLSGIDVLKLIKTDEKLKAIEVIMFSSLGDKTTLHECFELGAVDYINKPLDELEFLARIKSAIRKKTLEKSSLAYLREIEKQNESLSQLNLQLKTAQNQIVQQEKMASVGHLASGIAHEINNPLGFISSNFSTLRKYIEKYRMHLEDVKSCLKKELQQKGDEETFVKVVSNKEIDFINSDFEDLFNDTQEGLERVGAIVRGLRNFSRIDSLDEMSLYNLNEGIENTLVISRNEVKYIADVEIELGEVNDIYAYGGQVNQVLLNLLLNACSAIKSKHGSEKGTIAIKTWSNQDNVYISVRDNGSGIAPGHIKDVFNPFFTTKPVGEGTGLGLSISFDIICVKHKGWIDVKSEFGQWTEFVISLPIGKSFEDEFVL
jgi:signal transduction histidine kinase